MPLQALRAVSRAQNGVGAFILQCKRIDFHYCDVWGSNRGMIAYLKHHLADFAKQHPQIEITVSPRPNHHPVIRGVYMNGNEKSICVKNMEPTEIMKKLDIVKTANGEKLKRVTKPVKSMNESTRGIWSPFHGEEYKI